jgi:DNA mismatch repair protein MutL
MPIVELPPEVVRRIAAGEVVDHPSSVVKELIENSLDAKADKIKVEIHNGGKSQIIVDDNGIGMSKDELKMAVLPHTTSKIREFDDLFKIRSFGFRGEALASIGAVSKMLIETSQSGELGSSIEVKGGEIGEVKTVAKSKGTRITVSDLFFNVPARRKFLSSASVETRMVTEIIQKFILSHDVEFHYYRDEEETFNVSKGLSLEQRIKAVLAQVELVEVNSIFGGVRIHGYVSPPYVGKKNRTSEILFVNDRYVRSGLLMKAVENGYAEHLQKGTFPIAVLFIELPPQLVDVNVHPQKLEVKFSDNSKIFSMVVSAIKKSLASPDVFHIPSEKPLQVNEEPKFPSSSISPSTTHDSRQTSESFLPFREEKKEERKVQNELMPFEMGVDFRRRNEALLPNSQNQEREKLSESKLLGILHGRYIACESKSALYLIDMHAAHERILYDEFKSEASMTSQKLIMPVKLNLSPVQKELLQEREEDIKSFGFDWNDDELIAVPQIRHDVDWKEVFLEVLEAFRLSFAKDPRDSFFATLACKAAVKSEEKISEEEIQELLKKIDNLEVWSCPHGRPLVYSLEFKRLDRYFGR